MKQATRLTSAGKTPVKPAKELVNRVAVWFQPLCHQVWIPSDDSDKDAIGVPSPKKNRNQMIENIHASLDIRAANSEDVPGILEMVAELAEFEHLAHQLVATEEDYQESLFGDAPAAEALVATVSEELVGYAIFFSTFSTFVGRAGIWLEDLYVRPSFRKHGIGKKLLKAVGAIAEKRAAGRYEWCVLDWNQNAIDLYTQVGGEILNEWRIVRLDRAAIEALPEK